jgi:hypothetical protein
MVYLISWYRFGAFTRSILICSAVEQLKNDRVFSEDTFIIFYVVMEAHPRFTCCRFHCIICRVGTMPLSNIVWRVITKVYGVIRRHWLRRLRRIN